MHVILINGSPHAKGCTATALEEVAKTLQLGGVQTEEVWLGAGSVPGCSACGACKKRGTCIYDDAVNDIVSRADQVDGLVVGSPVYYGSASGQITSFLDRLFFTAAGRLAGKVAAAVVSCRRGGATMAFQQLNLYFSMNNMVIATSQYWNQVHGNTPEEVRQDLEGLQTMRTLGRNLVWLLQCQEAGRQAGLAMPEREPVIQTSFIR